MKKIILFCLSISFFNLFSSVISDEKWKEVYKAFAFQMYDLKNIKFQKAAVLEALSLIELNDRLKLKLKNIDIMKKIFENFQTMRIAYDSKISISNRCVGIFLINESGFEIKSSSKKGSKILPISISSVEKSDVDQISLNEKNYSGRGIGFIKLDNAIDIKSDAPKIIKFGFFTLGLKKESFINSVSISIKDDQKKVSLIISNGGFELPIKLNDDLASMFFNQNYQQWALILRSNKDSSVDSLGIVFVSEFDFPLMFSNFDESYLSGCVSNKQFSFDAQKTISKVSVDYDDDSDSIFYNNRRLSVLKDYASYKGFLEKSFYDESHNVIDLSQSLDLLLKAGPEFYNKKKINLLTKSILKSDFKYEDKSFFKI